MTAEEEARTQIGDKLKSFGWDHDVSRETLADLEHYLALLREWQKVKNLVSNSDLHCLWSRHVVDGIALFAQSPQSRAWLDLGSGAGIPGLVLAILLKRFSGSSVGLVEANGKKATFLRFVARELKLPVETHQTRVEDIDPLSWSGPLSVTARAFAPMPKLLELIEPWITAGKIGQAIFIKGEFWRDELLGSSGKVSPYRLTECSVDPFSTRLIRVEL